MPARFLNTGSRISPARSPIGTGLRLPPFTAMSLDLRPPSGRLASGPMSLAEESRKPGGAETGTIAARLIAWYDRHHRELPWRMTPAELAAGRRPDPYRVWLSEIMLQQTTVEAVKPYFRAFTERWPDVKALAA